MLSAKKITRKKARNRNTSQIFPIGIITQLLWVQFMDDNYHVKKVCVSDGYKELIVCFRKQISLGEVRRYLAGRNFLDVCDFNTPEVRGWGL